MRCPKCASDAIIPVDALFLWNLFNVKIRGRKVHPVRLEKQILFCTHCRKFFTMSDL